MYRAGRAFWGLVAVGAATAVGVTTRNPGFVAITFLGTWCCRGCSASRHGAGTGVGTAGTAWDGTAVAPAHPAETRKSNRRRRRPNRSDAHRGGAWPPPRRPTTMPTQ